MALDFEITVFGSALFALLLVLFFLMLRLSNRVIARKLNAISKKQSDSEKLLRKFAEMIAENRKEADKKIKGLRKELGIEEERTQASRNGVGIERMGGNAMQYENALARVNRKH